MGCDIHLFIEVKINDKWEFYGQIHMPRDYKIFSLMADVRNDYGINPISRKKGLPDNISQITNIHYEKWKEDAQCISWFNQKEIKILMKYIREKEDLYYGNGWRSIIGYLFGNSYEHLDKYKSDYPSEIQDVRWIFWFDNV